MMGKDIKQSFVNLLNNQFFRCVLSILIAYVILLFFLFLFRCIFFISNSEAITLVQDPNKWDYLFTAFRKGMRFDNVIASYITLLPLIIVSLLTIFNRLNKTTMKVVVLYFIVCGFILLGVSIADVPYYIYFEKHIDSSVLQWFEYPGETLGMLVGERSFLLYIAFFILLFSLYVFCFIKLYKFTVKKLSTQHYRTKDFIVNSCILIFLCLFFAGGTQGFIRDGLKRKHSAFCEEHLFCHGVMNPIFFFSDLPASMKLEYIINEKQAVDLIDRELNIDLTKDDFYINSLVSDTLDEKNPNIVIVYMESFASRYLDIKNKKGEPITPYIHKLIGQSYYFDRFYSQGTHTNQAIMSTLYGTPGIFDKIMTLKFHVKLCLERSQNKEFDNLRKRSTLHYGLPNDLKKQGYYNQMFVSHTKTFDNLDHFTTRNGFDRLYGSEDYSEAKQVNAWGISDGDLFDKAIKQIDSLSMENKPSLSSILTISNHPPYAYPDQFKEVSDNEDENALAYMDHCIERFMEEAKEKDWYDNTVFVFLGDHGRIFSSNIKNYIYPLSLNHVPLIIYSPMFENMPQQNSSLMGQIDVYPVLMSLIGETPAFNTFGLDVLSKERKYIYFTSDTKLACLSNDYFYSYDFTYDTECLYSTEDYTGENIIADNRATADSMRVYAASMIEGVKYIIKK